MIKIKSVPGPGPDAASVDVAFGEFEKVENAIAFVSGGYGARLTIAGNTVTVTPVYYDYGATVPGPGIDVPATDDLSAQTVTVIAEGY